MGRLKNDQIKTAIEMTQGRTVVDVGILCVLAIVCQMLHHQGITRITASTSHSNTLGQDYYCTHCIDEKTEVQRGQEMCPTYI